MTLNYYACRMSYRYPDIVHYLLYTTHFVTLEELKNYKSLQSHRYFTAGWVKEVLWRKYNQNVQVIGKVRHSFACSKSPLKCWAIIHENGTIHFGHCTCMAGASETCSHVGAILYWVEKMVEMRENVSSTSKENVWMPPAIKEITPKRLQDIPRSKPVVATKRSFQSPSQEDKDAFLSAISVEKKHRPVILPLTSPYSDEFLQSSEHLPLPLQTLFQVKYLSFNYFELLTMSIQYQITSISHEQQQRLASYTRGQSTNKQWYKYRAGRVTASTIYRVCRTDPHKPSVSLIK